MSNLHHSTENSTQSSLVMTAKDAIKALQESEDRFHDIADRIEQGLWVRSPEGKTCLYLNPAFESIWGRNIDQMNNTTWADTVHSDDRTDARNTYLQHQHGCDDYRQSYRVVRPNGEIRWVENRGYSILDKNGRLLRMAGIATDVTEQKKIEEELRLAQKLKSLGKLSTGLAHEINTPCQYVNNNVSFFAESFDDLKQILEQLPRLFSLSETAGVDKNELKRIQQLYQQADVEYLIDELPKALEQSKTGLNQINSIISAMKGFAHPSIEKTTTDINKIISDAIVIATSEWKYCAKMHTDFDNSLPTLHLAPPSITQIILNLLSNAIDAINEQKDKSDDTQQNTISIKTYTNNEHIFIAISDTGIGIPAHIIKEIFDPFYTTKDVGKGTGQGLSIVHKIICEDYQGKISVDSIVGQGSTFTIALPIINDSSSTAK